MIEKSKDESHVSPGASGVDEDGIPASERGKEENMSFEESQPSAVFGLVTLSYIAFLAVILGAIILYWVLNTSL